MTESKLRRPDWTRPLNRLDDKPNRVYEYSATKAYMDALEAENASLRAENQDEKAVNKAWVPAFVERAIRDLIPDVGHARDIARDAWKWDDEHPGHKNDLYRWQNEAIRQRRDLIALRMVYERGEEPTFTPPEA